MHPDGHGTRAHTVQRFTCVVFAVLVLAIGSLLANIPFSSTAHAMPKAPSGWHTFTDPVYKFTISYPPSWRLERGYDGSHITLVDPHTGSSMSPLVSGSAISPDSVLAQGTPAAVDQQRARATVTPRTIDGHPALDMYFPFIAPSAQKRHNAGFGVGAQREIVLPVANNAGSTNVYTFQAMFPTSRTGGMSAPVSADVTAVTSILTTFHLPSPITPVGGRISSSSAGTPNIGNSNCTNPPYPTQSVCWADNNYLYTQYNDVSQLYCDMNGYNYNSSNGTYSCADGINNHAVKVPTDGHTYFQPYFECAEFVARALSQGGDIPGLVNGGTYGSSPPTATWGSYSYGNFPMTYMGTSYSGNTVYDFNDTGTNTIRGLYQYLTTPTQSGDSLAGTGLGVPVSVSQAAPGDIVFFYTGSVSLANLEHVMIVTQSSGTTATTLLDGHNVDNYHVTLSFVAGGFAGYTILHMHANIGSFGHPSSTGSWNYTTDGYSQSIQWAYTGCSTCNTAGAAYTYASGLTCAIAIYVPSGNATAGVYFGVYNTSGGSVRRYVNENAIDGWALLYRIGELNSTYDKINVSNNTGTSGQQLGVGQEAFMC